MTEKRPNKVPMRPPGGLDRIRKVVTTYYMVALVQILDSEDEPTSVPNPIPANQLESNFLLHCPHEGWFAIPI